MLAETSNSRHTFMSKDAIQRRLFAIISCRSSMSLLSGFIGCLTSNRQEDYIWHSINTCIPLLDKYRYACFAHPEHSLAGPRDPGPGMLNFLAEPSAH